MTEQIDDVEYQLPAYAKGWISRAESTVIKHGNTITYRHYLVTYTPPDAKEDEIFTVEVQPNDENPLYFDDPLSWEEYEEGIWTGLEELAIARGILNPEVQIHWLEKSSLSVLAEVITFQGQEKESQSWVRAFLHQQEFVHMTYETTQINHVDQVKPLWLETLKSVKSIQSAEVKQIQDIEFHLPAYAKGWISRAESTVIKQGNAINYRHSLIKYTPPDAKEGEEPEIFTVEVEPDDGYHLCLDDPLFRQKYEEELRERLEEPIEGGFLNPKLQIHWLESSPLSMLTETILFEGQEKKVQSWGRTFSNQQEEVHMTYEITQIHRVDEVKPLWLETLKSAKFSRI